MTNEEKSEQIAISICGEPSPDDITGEFPCAEAAALEMAEWKDQQFKRALIRKIVEYEKKVHDVVEFNEGNIKVYIEPQKAIKQIINELFPEQEQNNSDNDE